MVIIGFILACVERDVPGAFGRKVRQARLALGWSQEELAHASGLHRTYIGAIERGERNVSIQNITRLARALNTSASQLLEDIS